MKVYLLAARLCMAVFAAALLAPRVTYAQSSAQSVYLGTVTQWGTGDLVIPLGEGGNTGYRIDVWVDGGWAQCSASFEVHKTWGVMNYSVVKSTFAFADMINRLRIHSKPHWEEGTYLTLTWRNDSPDKAYENFVRVEIYRIGGTATSSLSQNWNTGSTTSFSGFTDLTGQGLNLFAQGEKAILNNPLYIGGTLGIGAEAPSGYKLAVGGKLIAEEVKVKLQSAGWPDYVFSPRYKLRTLGELEAFIGRNGHLPDIPAATEVAKNGIELGDMNARLLKKIEELTLYLIEQEKNFRETTQSLQRQIDQLSRSGKQTKK